MYVVEDGDTVQSILRREGCISDDDLRIANPGMRPTNLHAGDRLVIPLITLADHARLNEERDGLTRDLASAQAAMQGLQKKFYDATRSSSSKEDALQELKEKLESAESRNAVMKFIILACIILICCCGYLASLFVRHTAQIDVQSKKIEKLESDLAAARERIADKLKSAEVIAKLKPEEISPYIDLVVELGKLGTRVPEMRRQIEAFIVRMSSEKPPEEQPALQVV